MTDTPAVGGRLNGSGRGKPGASKAKIQAGIEAALVADAATIDGPIGFEMRPNGLYRNPGDGKAFRICGPFEVVAESRPAGGSEWGLLLRWQDRDGEPHEWIMPRRLVVGEAMEVRAYLAAHGLDISATQGARQALIQYLSSVYTLARVRTVPRTGWYRPTAGGAAFVLPDRTIGAVPGETVRLDLDPAPPIYAARGTLADWQEHVAALCLDNTRLLLAVSAAFAAPLLPLIGDEGGGLNFRGESSKGKTTLIDAAASVWGPPSKTGADSFVRQWRTTSNALETTAAAHNHALLPMDEMGQADPREVLETLYMLANGKGKARARAGGGNRGETDFLTLVLSSSEESAARLADQAGRRIKAGQEVRMLDIPAVVEGGFGCFEELHGDAGGSEFAQRLRRAVVQDYGTAAPAFLEYLAGCLAGDIDWPAQAITAEVQRWCRDHTPKAADGQVHRAIRRFALVAIAGEMASAAGITGWPTGAASKAAEVICRDWLRERGSVGSREDQGLFRGFRTFIATHGSARFEAVREADPQDDALQSEPPLVEGPKTMLRAGWRWQEINSAGDRIWVYGMAPDVFDAEVAGPLGLEGREARARLGKAGLIREGVESGRTRWTYRPRHIRGQSRNLRLMVTDGDLLSAGDD